MAVCGSVVALAGCQQMGGSGVVGGSANGGLDPWSPTITGPNGTVSLIPTLAEMMAWQDAAPIHQPMWQGSTILGRVRLSNRRDRRQNAAQRAEFSINPEGEISGQEFLGITNPVAKDRFEQAMRMRGFTGDVDAEYTKYLTKLVNQGTALLAMNRILDHEAMKRMLPKEPTPERAEYVARGIIIQNGVSRELVPTRLEPVRDAEGNVMLENGRPIQTRVAAGHVPSSEFDRLYGGLKELLRNPSNPAQDHPVCFNVDWQYKDGGLEEEQRDMTRITPGSGELPLPSVTFEFRCGSAAAPTCRNRQQDVAITQSCVPSVTEDDLVFHIDEQGFYAGLVEITSAAHRERVRSEIRRAFDEVKPADVALLLKRENADEYRRLIRSTVERLGRNLGITIPTPVRTQVVGRAAQYAMAADFTRFQNEIRNMLKDTHTKIMRQAAWQSVVVETTPDISWRLNTAVTTQELSRLYSDLRESRFRVDTFKAEYHEITANGEAAQAFDQRYGRRMIDLQQALLAEVNPQLAAANAEEREAIRQRIFELRRTVPLQVMEELRAEFAADISAGRLRLASAQRELRWTSDQQLPPHATALADKMRAQLSGNPIFGMAPYPVLTAVESPTLRRIGVLEVVDQLGHSYLERTDPRVEPALRSIITAKAQGFEMRQVAYELFRENRFARTVDTCSQTPWPCQSFNPQLWAEEIFPETTYACREGDDPRWCGSITGDLGGTASSSIGRRAQMLKVRSIDLSLFQRAFQIRNRP
ncbi:MAG: hypothetical protein IT285_02385 [Bdellovibrionales bacterium]|nr:hypothetical protein [Bdellovibrionales bacterium]